MKRITIAVAVSVAGLLAVTGIAAAGVPHYSSTLDATGTLVGPGPERFLEYGQVHSA